MPLSPDLGGIIRLDPFSLDREQKTALFEDALAQLTQHHADRCEPYRRFLDALHFEPGRRTAVEDVPFLPVRLFKEHDLSSVDRSAIVRTMTSSGTSGQAVSRVHLDQETATNQAKALASIVASFAGNKRLPMLVVDSRSVLRDRNAFSARGAGIVGFSTLGRNVTFALDEHMNIDWPAIEAFHSQHGAGPVLMFGFTFMVWEHFCLPALRSGRTMPFADAILFHGGGWKKLADRAVGNEAFRQGLTESWGVRRVHNYYGMVEQAGSIFVECEAGYLHSSNLSDVIVRDAEFRACPPRQSGLMQVLSLLPHSYPGHSLLSEDAGEVIGEDDCSCGRRGKYFQIHGRIQHAEVRGCSDTYDAA